MWCYNTLLYICDMNATSIRKQTSFRLRFQRQWFNCTTKEKERFFQGNRIKITLIKDNREAVSHPCTVGSAGATPTANHDIAAPRLMADGEILVSSGSAGATPELSITSSLCGYFCCRGCEQILRSGCQTLLFYELCSSMENKDRKKLVFATNNPHKLEEVRAILGDKLDIVSLSEIGCHEDIPETADTLAGNALIKARWVKERYGYDCFADDTGLMVEALDGAPGVYSARYAGEHCSPADNVRKLLEEMKNEDNRKACFATVVALIEGDEEHLFEGRVDGRISHEAHGQGGFGYDPIFVAEETGICFAEMTPEDKNAISHRGRAIRGLADYLLND